MSPSTSVVRFDRSLTRRSLLAGAGAAAVFVVSRAGAQSASAVTAQTVEIPGAAKLSGFLARPRAAGKHPAIIVMHDLAGLTEHVKDIARRLATAGYIALAPDCVSALQGMEASDLIGLSRDDTVALMRAAVAALRARADYGGKIGALGFGWGGTAVNHLALADPTVAAVVAYYGLVPLYYQEDDYRAMQAVMLEHFAGRDVVNNQGVDNFRTSLSDVGKPLETHFYANTERGFDDAGGPEYDVAAADLAWRRSLTFFKQHLG